MKKVLPWIAVFGLLAACGESPKIQVPENVAPDIRIKSIFDQAAGMTSNDFKEIGYNPETGVLILKHAPKSILSGKSYITTYSMDVFNLAKTAIPLLQDGDPIKRLKIRGYVPTTDKYGKEGTAEAVEMDLDVLELRKVVDWKNLFSWDMWNFSETHISPVIRESAGEYCSDDTNRRYASGLCNRFY